MGVPPTPPSLVNELGLKQPASAHTSDRMKMAVANGG
jgi:hypothetical protein